MPPEGNDPSPKATAPERLGMIQPLVDACTTPMCALRMDLYADTIDRVDGGVRGVQTTQSACHCNKLHVRDCTRIVLASSLL